MREVAVIEDAAVAEMSLDPVRNRMLAELVTPASATMLAGRLGLPRQRVNYHLRTLESHGLVELVEERRKGNCVERVMLGVAKSYVISPAVLAAVQPDPARAPDRLSARWLLALASRLVCDTATLLSGATKVGKPLATYALDGEVRFATAVDRAAFAEELTAAVGRLVAQYHDEETEGGRAHRLVFAIHPSVPTDNNPGAS
ncbi:MAG TPA: helix-turn-helix domain-containing protein [Pseudonocardiaceae bacterium]|nr:helix-turn-helix domain-containing protein [Pseudonocardiaceae bacterium]